MRVITSIILLFITVASFAQTKEKDKELVAQAAKIKKELTLDDKTEHLVYNVLYHVKTRLGDIQLGKSNYDKLISYVDEERVSMMKSLLSTNKYKEYNKIFGEGEKQKLKDLAAKNTEYIKNNGALVNVVTSADIANNFLEIEDDTEDDTDEVEEP